MTDELITRIRSLDPAPSGSKPPPFSHLLGRLEATDATTHARGVRSRERRHAVARILVPAISVAVAVGVLVAAVGLLHARRAAPRSVGQVAAHGHASRALTSPPAHSVPLGGIRGLVRIKGVGVSGDGTTIISYEQCYPCLGSESQHPIDWLLTRAPSGRPITIRKLDYQLQSPQFAGANGWAGGLDGNVASYFVTHDGGRSWVVAPSAFANEGGSVPSVAGGEVWATGLGPAVGVEHGPVTGSRLVATAAQPISGDPTNVHVAGAGPARAYVINADVPRDAFVTSDDGVSWQRITAPPCAGAYPSALLESAFGDTVYVECSEAANGGAGIVVSRNGGRTWSRNAFGVSVGPYTIDATSSQVAWFLDGDRGLFRTTDAGRHWVNVSSSFPSRYLGVASEAKPAVLAAMSDTSAVLASDLADMYEGQRQPRTEFVLLRITDQGRVARRATVVPTLPLGSALPSVLHRRSTSAPGGTP